jgi:phosphoglycerol transferase MdoB-like AlkP superfamily enzyme
MGTFPATSTGMADTAARPRARAAVRGLWRRLWPAAMLAAFCVICFSAFRVALLVLHRDKLADVGFADLAKCVHTGLLYDSVPVAGLLLPLLALTLLPSERRLTGQGFRRLIAGYMTFVVAAVAVLETIGTAFFLHFGVRLNLVAVEYLVNAREVFGYIWTAYPAWALPLAVAAGVPLVYCLWAQRLWQKPVEPMPASTRWLAMLVLMGLCVFAARGWSVHYPLDMGTVYTRVATHTLLHEAARNNAFTLGHAVHACLFADDEHELKRYPFPSREDAYATTARLLAQPGDRPLASPKNPFWRRVGTGQPARPYNVVVILMESMAGPNVGCLGHADSVSPNLDRLADEGMFFDRCYAVGERTNRGITGVLCGFPDIGASSIVKQPRAQGMFLTLPELFAQRGYSTSFLYGGTPVFGNVGAFLSAAGVQNIIAQREIEAAGRSGPVTYWGLTDEVLLEHAHEVFEAHDEDQPFFAVVLTVSNHEPFDMPLEGTDLVDSDDFEVKKRNGVAYADRALGRFFDQARTSAYFDNTLFVLVADHGLYFNREHLIDIEGFRVPLILYGPNLTDAAGQPLVPPRRVSTVCSQTDIAPTVLGLLGGEFEHCFMGRDLLRAGLDPATGFALLHEGERLAFVTAHDAVMLPPGGKPHYVTLSEDGQVVTPQPTTPSNQPRVDELTHDMLSYYRTALDLFLTRAYGPQARE